MFMLTSSDVDDTESLSYAGGTRCFSDRGPSATVPRLRAFFSTAGGRRAGFVAPESSSRRAADGHDAPAGSPRPHPHSKSLGAAGREAPPLMRFHRQAEVTAETKYRMQRQMLSPHTALISKHDALSGSTHSK